MSNMVSKLVARSLAKAYGEVCKIRIVEDRSKAESLSALRAIHQLMEEQRESGISLMDYGKLDRFARILRAEADEA